MPGITIGIYITDEDYKVYMEHKEEMMKSARDHFKALLQNFVEAKKEMVQDEKIEQIVKEQKESLTE